MTDQQATTPLAAEVLAGLVGLGALAHVAADAAERGSPPDESPHRQLSGSSAAGERAGSVAVSVAGAAASMVSGPLLLASTVFTPAKLQSCAACFELTLRPSRCSAKLG